MKWTDEALKELENIPEFVRDMAVKAIESAAHASGQAEISAADVITSRQKYISFAEESAAEEEKIRIAVVRCETVSEVCPGVACFKAFNNRKQLFRQYGKEAEMIGFFTCGGCPGRRVSRLVKSLKKYGLNVVHLSSCMLLEDAYGKCPHHEDIKKTIEAAGIRVVEGTHH